MKDAASLKYYDLEGYVFNDVTATYQKNKTISTFDFFCIVVWKANRAKSKVAKRLLAQGYSNLNDAVTALLNAIAVATEPKQRLRVLIKDWGFRLPMASAILTVLFPEEFTIYDVRVCEILGSFTDIQYKTKFENLWSGYSEYVNAVIAAVDGRHSLRDKDRILWGRSFAKQLERDIRDSFDKIIEEPDLDP